MNDLDGSSDSGHSYLPNWNGGEWGFNNYSRLNGGITVAYDTFGDDQGLNARCGLGYGGTRLFTESSGQATGWLDGVTYGYANAANGNGDRNTGQGSWYAANTADSMATAIIERSAGGDLVVSVALPSFSPTEVMRTSVLGRHHRRRLRVRLAGRIGKATWDIQIDDFNVDYSYSTPVVPGVGGIAALAGLAAVRCRRR